MNPTDPTIAKNTDLWHREMYRRSQDMCMVYNPTDKDFTIDWDGNKWVVPNQNRSVGFGNGKLEVQRYLADWYCHHMKDRLINEMSQEKADELLAKRTAQGREAFVSKYDENKWLQTQVAKTDDVELIRTYRNVCFLGVTREFGSDIPEDERATPIDGKTNEERVMEELANKRYDPTATYVAPPQAQPTVSQDPPMTQAQERMAKARAARKIEKVTADEVSV